MSSSEKIVYVSGNWYAKPESRSLFDEFRACGIPTYDWTSKDHNRLAWREQHSTIKSLLKKDRCVAYVLYVADSNYGFGASTLEIGMAMGNDIPVVIIDTHGTYSDDEVRESSARPIRKMLEYFHNVPHMLRNVHNFEQNLFVFDNLDTGVRFVNDMWVRATGCVARDVPHPCAEEGDEGFPIVADKEE